MKTGIERLKEALTSIRAMDMPEADIHRENRQPECEGCGVWIDGWQQGVNDACDAIERIILEEGM